MPHRRTRRPSDRLRCLAEACEPRLLFSVVAPAYADKIGLAGVVNYSTTFEDNFDGTSIDKTKWQVRDGYRWRAYKDAPVSTFSYTDETPIQVGNGELQLIAHNDPVTNQLKGAFLQTGRHFDDLSKNSPVPPATLTDGYTGDFEQTYGYWESRAKFSSMPGEWAAFWVHSYRMVEVRDDPTKVNRPDVFGTEYDIAEHQPFRQGAPSAHDVTSIVHANGYGAYHKSSGFYNKTANLGPTKTPPEEYHVYGMLWTKADVRFYIDGNQVGGTSDPAMVSQIPQMAMLSVEVGAGGSKEPGKGSNSSGYTPAEGYGSKETSQARATFDYVRVWGLTNTPSVDPTTPANVDGVVYVDANADNMRQSGEVGQAGLTLFADYDGDGVRDADEPSAVTDAAGVYRIDGLRPHAEVDVTIVLPSGATLIAPESGKLTFWTRPGGSQPFRNFALAAPVQTTPTPPTTSVQLAGSAIGTAGSFGNGGNTIAKALDGSMSTYFDSAGGNGAWVGLDLGTAKTVTSIKYAPRVGWAGRMVGGLLQASATADFSGGVVTLATVTAKPAENALTTIAVEDVGAFRYVRFLSPSGGYGNVAELQWFGPGTGTVPVDPPPTDPNPPAVPVPLTGTLLGTAGSFSNSGNTISKAVDGSLATYFDAASGNGAWVGFDLGTAKNITSIKYAPRGGWTGRMVGGLFQASTSADFTTSVVTLATVTAKPTENVLTAIAVSNATAFRYVRYLSPNGGYGNVAEVQFFGDGTTPIEPPPTNPNPPTTSVQLAGSAIGTAGSFGNGGNTIAKALDGSLATYFDSAGGNGAWVGLDLGTAKTVTSVKYAPRVGWAGRMVGGLFQASATADFSAGVVTLATVTAKPAENALTTIAVEDVGAFRYVRFLSPRGGYGNVAELQWFGTTPA